MAGNKSVIENNLFLHNEWTGHTPGNGATLRCVFIIIICIFILHKNWADNTLLRLSRPMTLSSTTPSSPTGKRLESDLGIVQGSSITRSLVSVREGLPTTVQQSRFIPTKFNFWFPKKSNLHEGANKSYGGGSRQSQLGTWLSKGWLPVWQQSRKVGRWWHKAFDWFRSWATFQRKRMELHNYFHEIRETSKKINLELNSTKERTTKNSEKVQIAILRACEFLESSKISLMAW